MNRTIRKLFRSNKISGKLDKRFAKACSTELRRLENSEEQLEQRIEDLQRTVSGLKKNIGWLLNRETESRPSGKLFRSLRQLFRHFARFKHLFYALPMSDLEMVDESGFRWRSLGYDPQFLLKPVVAGFPKGWTLLRFHMSLKEGNQFAKLYLDRGQGFMEETSTIIPVSMKGNVNHLVRLPSDIKAIRLDPLENPGDVAFDKIVFYEIGWPERVWRMVRRIVPALKQEEGAESRSPYYWLSALSNLTDNYVKVSYAKLRVSSNSTAYQYWIDANDTLSQKDRRRILNHMSSLRRQPLISLIMPVYNTPEIFLRKAIESVINQLYPRWELCIADDASTETGVRDVLEEYVSKDKRIKVVYRKINGHISAASNTALALSAGDYIALLDHDDELPPHALYSVVNEVNEHPRSKIIYSDEDKINAVGIRSVPHFKPDWNPELFFSHNYIGHLSVIKAEVVREVGGFREGFEGSQDYDLLLRSISFVNSAEILHIPRILYHWRSIAGSTALSADAKQYTTNAGVKALSDYFKRIDPKVKVEPGLFPNTYRIRYPIPDCPPLVSLIIPTRNRKALVERCIASIEQKTNYKNYEILIVNNQSDDPETLAYFESLRAETNIRIIDFDGPFNFAAINNFAVENAKGEIVGLINNDVEVIAEEWLTEMLSYAVRPDIGAVGAKLLYPDGLLQHGGVIIGIGGVAGHSHKFLHRDDHGYFERASLPQQMSAVTAACLLVRKALYKEVGGMDAENLAVAFNDVDFCLRLQKAGYRNIWTPYALLYHHESVSRGYEDSPEKIARFQKEIQFMKEKWGELLSADPSYNPNLTLDREDFGLTISPRTKHLFS